MYSYSVIDECCSSSIIPCSMNERTRDEDLFVHVQIAFDAPPLFDRALSLRPSESELQIVLYHLHHTE